MEHDIRTHNISMLADEIYDKLANNTDNDMFNCNDIDLTDMYVDSNAGTITINYHDKKFVVVIREDY